MTDEVKNREVLDAMRSARVPRVYHSTEVTLTTASAKAKKVFEWMCGDGSTACRKLQGVVEFVGTDKDTTDAFYLYGRGLVMNSVALCNFNALDLAEADAETGELIRKQRVLAIAGFTNEGINPLTERERYRLEWRLIEWLQGGNSIVFLNDVVLASDKVYSSRFRNIIKPFILAQF